MVIDASIATKWFLKEEDSHLANALLKQNISLLAPALIRLEVSAAIAKAVRFNAITVPDAQRQFSIWNECLKKGMIQLETPVEHNLQAFEVAIDIGHPLQDCLYLEVAQRYSLPLLTADKKLIENAPRAGVEIKKIEDIVVQH